MKIEIYDFVNEGYEDKTGLDENLPVSLLNEVISILDSKAALRAYFSCLIGATTDEFEIAESEEGIEGLVKFGYLKPRADGKYCFYASVVKSEDESLGDALYEDWNPEVDSLKDIDDDREKKITLVYNNRRDWT